MNTEANKDTALRALEALMRDDAAGVEALLAEDCILHRSGFPETITGASSIAGMVGSGEPFGERRRWVESAIAEGDMVAVHWMTTGLHTCHFLKPPTGKRVTFASMAMARVKDGKLTEIWVIQDVATILNQLNQPAEPAAPSR
ncbi:MAG TPA: ester cyclase [Chloroflexota bacterium]